MFNWIKRLLGNNPPEEPTTIVVTAPEPLVLEDPVNEAPKPKKTTAAKPKKTKKVETIDLDSMSKTQLLAEAKSRGIKANASLKKDEILERIKSA